jgi:hypothetical protein
MPRRVENFSDENLHCTHHDRGHPYPDKNPSDKNGRERSSESEEKGPQTPDDWKEGHDHARTDSGEHRSHRDLKQCKRVEISAPEDAEGFCVEA